MSAPTTLQRGGSASWSLIGVLAVAAVAYTALSTLSGLVIPLVIATVIGMLAVPLVDVLERWRVPRSLGAVLVIVAITVAFVGSIALAVNGVIDQADDIQTSLEAGVAQVNQWLTDLDLGLGAPDERVDQAKQFGLDMLPGLASWFSGLFSGVVSFAAGTFLAFFLLYFILVDWTRLRDWVGRHLGLEPDLGVSVVEDATMVIRQGFAALTVSSVAVAVLIGLTMVVLGLPLAFTIALVTFATSYIPYLGDVLSAVLACLVALGSGSGQEAFILLIVILVVQNVVQTVIATKMTSDRLRIHPIASLISTIVGAALAGLLGATLSSPVLAAAIRIRERLLLHEAGDQPSD